MAVAKAERLFTRLQLIVRHLAAHHRYAVASQEYPGSQPKKSRIAPCWRMAQSHQLPGEAAARHCESVLNIQCINMTTTHVFIATSLDGFIARPDGDIGWLLQRDDSTEDHGYAAFIADKDAILMGRGTYEKALTFGAWPYDVPVLVLSQQLADGPVPDALKGKVRFTGCTPREAIEQLAGENVRRIYVDGGQLIQSFLRDGLITDMVITTVPVLIGSGKPLFGALTRDIDLELTSSRSFPSGLVQSTYRLVP